MSRLMLWAAPPAGLARRSCLRGLVGTGVWLGAGAPAWAAGGGAPALQLLCVGLPPARALAARLAPGAHAQVLAPQRQTDAGWWQALAARLQGQTVIAVLDERAAVLWDALLSPAAHHTEHRLWRLAQAAPLHVLQQRFD